MFFIFYHFFSSLLDFLDSFIQFTFSISCNYFLPLYYHQAYLSLFSITSTTHKKDRLFCKSILTFTNSLSFFTFIYFFACLTELSSLEYSSLSLSYSINVLLFHSFLLCFLFTRLFHYFIILFFFFQYILTIFLH